MENKLLKFFKKISTFENGNTTLKDWSKGGLEPTLLILLWKPVLHVRGEVRFWRAGTGHVRGGGQYDLMESVSAKGGFEPASELTSKQVRSKIESYGFGLRAGVFEQFMGEKNRGRLKSTPVFLHAHKMWHFWTHKDGGDWRSSQLWWRHKNLSSEIWGIS